MRNLMLTLIIWMICFTAVTVGISLTYKWYKNIGKNVTITFNDVSGLVPNQSKILYLGVQIGDINSIALDPETGRPIVHAKINKHAIQLLGANSKFWIVSPEFGLGEIENLSTIATGNYIAVNPIPGPITDKYVGLDLPPVDNEFAATLTIKLKANSAPGVEPGSAILYRDLQIGEVGNMGLSKDRKHVLITIYINAPYADVIRKNSYFANISGFHASIHIFGGSEISLNSIRTLVKGGIAVTSPDPQGPPAKDNDVFKLLSREELQALQERC